MTIYPEAHGPDMNDTLRCSRCKRDDLELEAFSPSHRKSGNWCKECRTAYGIAWRAGEIVRESKSNIMRICSDCGIRCQGSRCRTCHGKYIGSLTKERPRKERPTLITHGRKPAGHRWRKAQLAVLATETDCGICGQEINMSLPRLDRMAWTIDHIIPWSIGGAMYERSNLRLAHRSCNCRLGSTLHRDIQRERLALARAALWIGEQFLCQ